MSDIEDWATETDEQAAAREAFACPDCTANRGEHCRDVLGAGAPLHDSRVARYRREGDPAIVAHAVGTVSDASADDATDGDG